MSYKTYGTAHLRFIQEPEKNTMAVPAVFVMKTFRVKS